MTRSCARKRRGRALPADPTDDRARSHDVIGAAIAEAARGLSDATGLAWRLKRDSRYQMSNRFAWSWKLLSLGLPVVLVYLGFLNSDEMTDRGAPFADPADWEGLVTDHSRPLFPAEVWGRRWEVEGQPFAALIRSVEQPPGRAGMTTDTSERGLESLIVAQMTGQALDGPPHGGMSEAPEPFVGLHNWRLGDPQDYDREYCVDLTQLAGFLRTTQPDAAEALSLDEDGPTRRQFLARLQGEVSKRGTIEVLRRGVSHGPHHLDLFYGTPSPGNEKAAALHAENRFSVTRQLRYSRDETQLALDLGLFVNGLPIATFELKNSLTKQTVEDAVQQYRRDRDPREKLFEFGRCVVHFAVDDQEVRFCSHLQGKASWFLPFNKGWNDGAGNPPNPTGLKTDYLWKQVLTPAGLTDILENYAQITETKDPKTGRKKRTQIWPRYHQLEVVRRLLADAAAEGAGRRYLIQHSAGSGKSNSIAWLAHQMIGLEKDGAAVFDSIIVVTDRRILDQQIRDTIKQFAQVGATVGHAEHSGDLRRFIAEGKKIIISTVQKFPFILDEIGSEHRGRRFAIVIDEAHSSQGGRTSAALAMALAADGAEPEEETLEDRINRLMEAKKMLPNASYFAFTATPKNKTLEIFGLAEPQTDGKVPHRAFHSYTMKQAVQEGFILDVLQHYTPVDSYYRLVKTVAADPEFDIKRAQKKLRRYVESHDHAIRLKAEIMVDHFHEQVVGLNKIGGQGAGHGGDQRYRPRDPVLSCHSRLFEGTQESLPGHRRLLGRARGRRRDGDGSLAQRLPVEQDCREDPGRPLPLPHLCRQVPDRLRRAAAAQHVRRQGALEHQSGTDALSPQPGAPGEA